MLSGRASADSGELVELVSSAVHVSILCAPGGPEIVSIGPPIADFRLALLDRPVPHAAVDGSPAIGIVADGTAGFVGRPGARGMRPDGSGWSPRFAMRSFDQPDATSLVVDLADECAELALTVEVRVDDLVTVAAELRNDGTTPYHVAGLTITVPMPSHADELMTFSGRWCREFQPDRRTFDGLTAVENRTGRTSHWQLPAVFVGERAFDEQRGEVWGVQLAWSGNYEMVAERLQDGQRYLQAGELLEPGEVELAAGESYRTPDVAIAWSPAGLTHASQAFHRFVRRHSPSSGPRPVVLNTWEAVYFDHDAATLGALADVAAQAGVERFVLDDGWFGGRRDDTAGLGDWWVSDAAWPNGLGPIVDRVRALGMEFGLWVEPEMVNPDSDLFRQHPDWVLATDGYEPVLGRHQLVLDLGRAEVRDHLFDAIDVLLTEHEIAYLKWDMNRDIVHGSRHGRAGVHGHVVGVYQLIDRIREAHPELEIESCASGGGRADLGILRRADRIWTSDCNDAVERQQIQRGFSMLFPPEVMGAHIGPGRAHTTGRRQDLPFRAATALFGHMGIEWNLLQADERQRALVADAIGFHRRWREVLHSGRTVRVDHPDPSAIVHGVVSDDTRTALFAYVQLQPSSFTVPLPLRFADLDLDATYRVRVVDELGRPTNFGLTEPSWMAGDVAATGRQLCERGVQPPILLPETVLLIELETTS